MQTLHKSTQYKELVRSLKIDCRKCSGLCCTALYFSKSEGFPNDKPAGKPCTNLMSDFSCAVHKKLMQYNLKGCMAFDCLGAGQKVTSDIYGGVSWKQRPEAASEIFQVFLAVWQLHQMVWYLAEAAAVIPAEKLAEDIDALITEYKNMTALPSDQILQIDIEEYRTRVNLILKKAGELTANSIAPGKNTVRRSDNMGKNFKKANLDGQDLSMSLLIAANLEGCSLFGTNFLGADMRDTNIRNADLSESLFLTQAQVNAARGNENTKLPKTLCRPKSWKGQ
ncbi:pentapeptide repeat-containing protein [Robinsoniella peoriensis]|uniref:pentapeptide repeat-containing protein n=1 Tax=Robinsoniella peoriensis TaxID=180332 RepID=UPI0037529D20